MKYIAALLLAQLGGNDSVKKDDVKKILSASGADVDESRIDELIEKVGESTLPDLIAEGRKKLSEKVVVVESSGSSAAAPAAAAEEKAAEKVEEKKEEEEEEDFVCQLLFISLTCLLYISNTLIFI